MQQIATLPPQLVALVLQHVDVPDRFKGSATVCSDWQTAAVLATNHIVAGAANQQKCAALSQWLQAHAATAQVESISVQGYGCDRSTLKLPVEQLPKLRKLCLMSVSVSMEGRGG